MPPVWAECPHTMEEEMPNWTRAAISSPDWGIGYQWGLVLEQRLTVRPPSPLSQALGCRETRVSGFDGVCWLAEGDLLLEGVTISWFKGGRACGFPL